MDCTDLALLRSLLAVFDTGVFCLHAILLQADGSHLSTATDDWFRSTDDATSSRYGCSLAHIACMTARDLAPEADGSFTVCSRLHVLIRVLQIRPGMAHSRDRVSTATGLPARG